MNDNIIQNLQESLQNTLQTLHTCYNRRSSPEEIIGLAVYRSMYDTYRQRQAQNQIDFANIFNELETELLQIQESLSQCATQTLMSLPTIAQKDFINPCPICLDTIKKDESIRILSCSHMFHQKCIDRWLRQKKHCPFCRKECL